MSRRERGQALVEVVVALPVCLVCALTLVDCGVIVRDRVAVAQAATRAAEAHVNGTDELEAARSALPSSLDGRARVAVRSDRVTVTARSAARIAKLAGAPVEHRSSVAFDVSEVAR